MSGTNGSYPLRSLPILLGLAANLALCPLAMAEDLDPFQVDTGHWMSFERYNDNIKHNRPVGNEALGEAPKNQAPPSETDNGALATTSPAATAQAASSTPVVAAPMRPLDLPVLPGVNKDFSIQVDSTLDTTASTSAQIVQTDGGQSSLHLQEQNWQDAAEVAREHASEKNAAVTDSARSPLEVRMSFLPNPKITPEFGPERKPRPRLVEVPSAPTRKALPEAPQKTVAECNAVDAYKKKQLEAIQSDRKTLQALQSAITDLGLQKQLDFMAGAQQSPTLNASAPNAATGAASASPTATP